MFGTSVGHFHSICRIFAVIATMAFCPGTSTLPAIGAPVESDEAKLRQNFNPHGQLIEPMKDGAAFIGEMYSDIEKLNDYQLVFETKTFKKNTTVIEAGNLYFKKPKLMRLEETGEFNKGSVAVIGKGGMARAHGGGIAGIVTLTLKPDDKMLDAANGDKMQDSDFLSLATILKEKLKSGISSRVTEKPVTVSGVSEPVYVLELFHANDPKLCLKRIFVHPKTNLPVRWDDYDYKDPCLSTWREVKTNIGLSDDLFNL